MSRFREPGEPQQNDDGAGARRVPNWIIAVIAIVGSLQLLYLNYVEADRMFVHRREISRLEQEVSDMRAEQQALALIAERADDQVLREQLARKQGFIYPHELRVITQGP